MGPTEQWHRPEPYKKLKDDCSRLSTIESLRPQSTAYYCRRVDHQRKFQIFPLVFFQHTYSTRTTLALAHPRRVEPARPRQSTAVRRPELPKRRRRDRGEASAARRAPAESTRSRGPNRTAATVERRDRERNQRVESNAGSGPSRLPRCNDTQPPGSRVPTAL